MWWKLELLRDTDHENAHDEDYLMKRGLRNLLPTAQPSLTQMDDDEYFELSLEICQETIYLFHTKSIITNSIITHFTSNPVIDL